MSLNETFHSDSLMGQFAYNGQHVGMCRDIVHRSDSLATPPPEPQGTAVTLVDEGREWHNLPGYLTGHLDGLALVPLTGSFPLDSLMGQYADNSKHVGVSPTIVRLESPQVIHTARQEMPHGGVNFSFDTAADVGIASNYDMLHELLHLKHEGEVQGTYPRAITMRKGMICPDEFLESLGAKTGSTRLHSQFPLPDNVIVWPGMPPQAAVHKASEVKDDEPEPAALEEGQGSGAITALVVSHPAPVTSVPDGARTASAMPALTPVATISNGSAQAPPPTRSERSAAEQRLMSRVQAHHEAHGHRNRRNTILSMEW